MKTNWENMMDELTSQVMATKERFGLEVGQVEALQKHLELVIEANKTTNLTRIASPEEAWMLHVEDSLEGLPEVNGAPVGPLGDMGCGAGFPGIPLAVATGRKTVLIDSVGKKIALVQQFLAELGLDEKVSTYAGRLEDLCESRRGSFAVLVARALSQTGSLMELAAPLLMMGGRLVCYKGQPGEEEIAHAMGLQETLGLTLVSRRDFVLSDGETQRCILVFEKTAKPKVKLPRRVGMAQKKPL